MEVKEIPIEQVIPYERNAKKHPEEQIQQIANSLKEFGWQQPLVLDKDNVIVIGHGRLYAAKLLGFDTVPIVYADKLNKSQIKALRLADNKVNESGWDFNLLDEELLDLTEIDMSQFGFDNISPDDFGDEFTLPDGDKPEICQMTFTLHESQKGLIEKALDDVDECRDTFGNTNKNGNSLYEVVRQWEEQRK